ncbi:hypothetical protein IW140_005010 [Coemansia sp. RSA 1813]|nr:hypothetical protein IW140_005010 [Coemansia sp. RSA 1813]
MAQFPNTNSSTSSSTSSNGSNGSKSGVHEQVHFPTPMSLSIPPVTAATVSSTVGTTTAVDLPSMSPLTIGGMEGLTDQQAAEVVELLTPFLSPTSTPLVLGMTQQQQQQALANRTFSPLTSPALMSQQQQQQYNQFQFQQQSAADSISMPPPSPSITAEHFMRRQQMQHIDKHTISSGNARRARRGTNTTTSHHPYRSTTQQQQQQPQQPQQPQAQQNRWTSEDYLLDSLAASLQNTPSLQFTTSSSATSNVFAGLNLPDSIFASTSSDINQLPSDSTATTQSSNQQTIQQQASRTLHQLNDTQPATATPASLLNLPSSAHHLPHTSTGEIVSPQSTCPPPIAQQQQQQRRIAGASTQQQQQQSSLLPEFLIHSAPMPAEFLHPPAPPLLQIDKNSSSSNSNSNNNNNSNNGGKRQRGGRRKSMTATTDRPPLSGAIAKPKRNEATRRRSRQALLSPRTTPLVPSTLKSISSPGISPALAPLAPAAEPYSNGAASKTPQMRPRGSAMVVAATSTTNIVGLEADVVTRLATKSNYQNIMEGKSELLGLNYRTEFKSGLEKRRTNHKQAEQKRRDSLKLCFQDLHHRLPDVDPKQVSKIYLLNKANGYIDALRRANERIAEVAREKGIDVDAIMAEVFDNADDSCQEEGEENGEEDL